jgi:alkylation response protein AidB-like acyl-CoA dehydrogenase
MLLLSIVESGPDQRTPAHACKQLGQAIGKLQSVANRIVDMKLCYETARLLIYKMDWLTQKNASADMDAAIASCMSRNHL